MCKNINIVILSLIFCSISQATIAPPLNPPTPSPKSAIPKKDNPPQQAKPQIPTNPSIKHPYVIESKIYGIEDVQSSKPIKPGQFSLLAFIDNTKQMPNPVKKQIKVVQDQNKNQTGLGLSGNETQASGNTTEGNNSNIRNQTKNKENIPTSQPQNINPGSKAIETSVDNNQPIKIQAFITPTPNLVINNVIDNPVKLGQQIKIISWIYGFD